MEEPGPGGGGGAVPRPDHTLPSLLFSTSLSEALEVFLPAFALLH